MDEFRALTKRENVLDKKIVFKKINVFFIYIYLYI